MSRFDDIFCTVFVFYWDANSFVFAKFKHLHWLWSDENNCKYVDNETRIEIFFRFRSIWWTFALWCRCSSAQPFSSFFSISSLFRFQFILCYFFFLLLLFFISALKLLAIDIFVWLLEFDFVACFQLIL